MKKVIYNLIFFSFFNLYSLAVFSIANLEKIYRDYYKGFLPEGLVVNSNLDFLNHYFKELDKIIEHPKNGMNFEKYQAIKLAAVIEKSRMLQLSEGQKNRLSFSILKNSFNENIDYLNKNDIKKMDPFYLCKAGELISAYMVYLGFPKIIKLGSKVNKLQKASIKQKKNNFCAYLNLGVGAFFTPVIGGGGLKKSLNYLKQAEKNAIKDYQKYKLYVWLSQVHFSLKNKDISQYFIKKADDLFPQGEFHKSALKKNEQGKTFK